MQNKITIGLAAGGTGGHIFPAIALAKELARRGYRPILFTDRRYKAYGAHKYDIESFILPLDHYRGGFWNKVKFTFQLGLSFFSSIKKLKKEDVKFVVGFGGYPSFPTLKAAQIVKIKTAIHEQNSVLGRANRMLIPGTKAVALTFSSTAGVEEKYRSKVYFTGNPVRPEIQLINALPYPDFNDNSKLHIFVTGGSQGAKIFARVIPQAIKMLPIEFRRRVRIDQQCREEDLEYVKRQYNELDVDAELSHFFSDVANRLASAHLLICRSGASSLAEASVAGKPTIMVPLPNSKDNHQHNNAIAFEDLGAGMVITQESFTSENLSLKLENFFRLPEILVNMAGCAKQSAIINADKRLADIIEELLTQESLLR